MKACLKNVGTPEGIVKTTIKRMNLYSAGHANTVLLLLTSSMTAVFLF
jgi:hypothetical protein